MLLTHANLQGANLEGVNLGDTILCNANLEGANLKNTILYNANLLGANLKNAVGIVAFPRIGSRIDTLYVVLHGRSFMFKTGCFWGTRKEFLEAIKRAHGNDRHAKAYRKAIKSVGKMFIR